MSERISAIRTRFRCIIRRATEAGAAMVEFALMLPVLMILVAGIVELGDGLNSYLSVIAASRDGARLGSKGGASDTEIKALVITNMGKLRDTTATSDITITRSTVSGIDRIAVKTCNKHKLLMKYPLLPISNPLKMCSTTTMRVLG